MSDWTTTGASLATAVGTLVLSVATFASVRSANRVARTAERSLLEGLRPLLVNSRLQDAPEKFSFVDQHWVRVEGGHAPPKSPTTSSTSRWLCATSAEGWVCCTAGSSAGATTSARPDHVPIDDFRRLTRDLYIPPGDFGLWQRALRDPAEPLFAEVQEMAKSDEIISIELLYSDQEGGAAGRYPVRTVVA